MTKLVLLTCDTGYMQDVREKLTLRIQNAGTEVVEAKAGAVSIHFMNTVCCCNTCDFC